MGYYKPLTYTLPLEEEGFILKTILQKRMHVSRKLLSRLKLTEQGIMVNGKREYISVRLQAGDRVEVRMEQEVSTDIMAQNLPLQVMYEDEHILIVNKAAGMVVHPTHGHYINTLANAVVYYWQQRGERVRFRPIHRLDQETSGVMAIAKHPYAHQQIAEQMKANEVKKEYIAVVFGDLLDAEGTIDAPIDRDPDNPHLRIVTETGYPAVTHYKVEQCYRQASLVRIWLQTGRTHQIRVHMKHLGCPLIGDKLYHGSMNDNAVNNSWSATSIQRHALHAIRLELLHPVSKQRMEFVAELPDDLNKLIAYLSQSAR